MCKVNTKWEKSGVNELNYSDYFGFIVDQSQTTCDEPRS